MAPSRVIRGGSWINNAENCRSANRNNNDPGNRNNNLGVRLLKFIIMPEAYCSWIVCPCVDNDQTVYPAPVFAGQRDMRSLPLVGLINFDGGSDVREYINEKIIKEMKNN